MKQTVICSLFILFALFSVTTSAASNHQFKFSNQPPANLQKSDQEILAEINRLQAQNENLVNEMSASKAQISKLDIKVDRLEDQYEHLAVNCTSTCQR